MSPARVLRFDLAVKEESWQTARQFFLKSDNRVETNNKLASTLPSISLLRLRVATNLFKQLLLKDLHIAGNPQVSAVFDALANAGCEQKLSEKTWRSWFSKSALIPKVAKAKVLDTFASSAIRVPALRGFTTAPLPDGTFSKLIHGGLVQSLTAPSQAKKLLPVLLTRALEYKPASSLHLHIDAMEIGAHAIGVGDLPWTTVKAIGAKRILEILTARWSPRHGTVYSNLSSDLVLKWLSANEDERRSIRKSYARFKLDQFQYFMEEAPQPDWNKVKIDANVYPTNIHKALFSLAADSSFLVADRMSTWSLDLATAALAMHALAWTDRYTTFGGVRVTEEMIFWGVFVNLLFQDDEPSFEQFGLLPAMAISPAEWDDTSESTLLQGRTIYRAKLEELGTSAAEIFDIAMQSTEIHPIIYTG